MPIALRVLASLLFAATHSSYRLLSSFNCSCLSRDRTSAQQRQLSTASIVSVAPLRET
jgi:hypothetical protein